MYNIVLAEGCDDLGVPASASELCLVAEKQVLVNVSARPIVRHE